MAGAYYDRSDAWHARARRVVEGERGGLIVPAPLLPEVDHLLGRRLGARARLATVAIAESLGVPRVATTDRRHFEPLAAALALELLP